MVGGRMTAEAFTMEVTRLKRGRVTCALVRSFTWYRSLGPERQHAAETRIAMLCGGEPCTPEAWILTKEEIAIMDETNTPKMITVNADISQEERMPANDIPRHRIDLRVEDVYVTRDFLRVHRGKMVRVTIEVL